MNTYSAEGPIAQQIEITMPAGVRAVLVSLDDDSSFRQTPVQYGKSVLNIREDLMDHLNASPYSDEWLTSLRDFLNAKLEARGVARRIGGLSIPHPDGRGFAVTTDYKLMQDLVVL